MALLARIYFNTVFGALGGLLGWMLFGAFGDAQASNAGQWLLGGAIIGGSIGYFVVSVEAIRDRSLVRFCRLASYGVVLGAAGGAVGMWVGEKVAYELVEQFTVGSSAGGAVSPGRRAGEVLARGLGWLLLGLAIGLSEGVAARSWRKLCYGSVGGALGGLVGGVGYGLWKTFTREDASDVWGPALGLVLLGAAIGALSALVQGVLQPASVKVLRGWQEGREYPLLKGNTLLGRDERADIALFRDMQIQKRHAIIQRQGDRFILINNGAAPEQTRVNDAPVDRHRHLQDGDRIRLGNVVLRFQMRAARIKR